MHKGLKTIMILITKHKAKTHEGVKQQQQGNITHGLNRNIKLDWNKTRLDIYYSD